MKKLPTSDFSNAVRKFTNAVIGKNSQYTERLTNGVTSFVYSRERVRNLDIIQKNILAKFPKHVSIKITDPSPLSVNVGWIRIYASK